MSSHQVAEFSGLQIAIYQLNGIRWVQARDVGRALGYAKPDDITRIYRRHADEFGVVDTCTAKMAVQGQDREVRLFSETGAVLLTMFANTSRAKDFRVWAKNVLAGELRAIAHPGTASLPRIEQHMEAMADNMAQLTRISVQQAAKLEVTARYIELLEINQRGHAKVTPDVERAVLEMKAQGMSQSSIARLLRISVATVSMLVNGKYPRNASYDGEPPKPTLAQALDSIAEHAVEQQLGEGGCHE